MSLLMPAWLSSINAVLTGAYLWGWNLAGASAINANLSSANLSGATLSGANLIDSKLANATTAANAKSGYMYGIVANGTFASGYITGSCPATANCLPFGE